MKKKVKFGRIYVDLFNSNIYYVCCSRYEYDSLIDKTFNAVIPEGKEKLAGTCEGYDKDGKTVHVIWISERNKKDGTVIAHESFHATCKILADIGIWHTSSSEEVYGYLMQFIMIEIVNDWKKK